MRHQHFFVILSFVASTGCPGPDPSLAPEVAQSAGEALVSTSAPVAGPDYTGLPPLPGLIDGTEPVSSWVYTVDSHAIHDGVHFNGRDLAGPATDAATGWDPDTGPVEGACEEAVFDPSSWFAEAAGDEYASTNPYAPRLCYAVAEGELQEDNLDDSAINWAFSVFGIASQTLDTESLGLPTDRARWQSTAAEWVPDPKFGWTLQQIYYDDPDHFAETRLRGARQYCAAREATLQQAGQISSMGQQAAATFEVLGREIKVLAIEPTVVLDAPRKFTGGATADGAQAFSVPLLLGTRITPIDGVGIPGLGEIRSPATLVSGDSEVRSAYATNASAYDSYQTVSQANALVSSQKSIDGKEKEITLYKVGPLSVYMTFDLDMEVGAHQLNPVTLSAGAPGAGPAARAGDVSDPNFFATYDGHTYYDGAWTLDSFVPPLPGQSRILFPNTNYAQGMISYHPFLTRAFHDDDHEMSKRTTARLTVALAAGAGIDIKKPIVLQAQILVSGGLAGTAGVVHTVRDAAYAQEGPRVLEPQTGVVVTPSTEAALDFVSKAVLRFALGLPIIGTVRWSETLYDVNVPLAQWKSGPWPEERRLRIGTGSIKGDVTKQPDVASHLPSHKHFPSFPTNVDHCLADEELPDEDIPLCKPHIDGTTPPEANICVYAESAPNAFAYPANICASIDSYVNSLFFFSGEKRDCIRAQLKWTCQPVSMVQFKSGTSRVVSHIVDIEDSAVMLELAEVMDKCGQAFGGTEQAVKDLFGFGACDDNADLYDGDFIIPDEGWGTGDAPIDGECK